jgi:phosphoribosylformylglycinamidine synthase subunit PurL
MGSRGGAGVEIDVALVPQRETGMTPYEIMLSESQERMLLVAKPGREKEVEAIFEKWDLHAARIGRVTDDGRMRVKEKGVVVAEIPNTALTDDAPLYRRPMAVRTNTLVFPGMGAGVVRVKGTNRALALSVDCNGRFVYLDPRRGAQLAVAEASRNVACAGAEPIGATNCLNFGNPQKPEIMWQFAKAVEGMGEACRALGIPITGGNVSLYNETDGRGVLPTPVLGVVGLIENAERTLRRAFQASGDVVVLLGESRPELGGSEYLAVMHGAIAGVPPALDLEREASLQRLLVQGAAAGLLRSAHDCADGGLAITVAESCFDTGLGVTVDVASVTAPESWEDVAALFTESASRVVVSVAPERLGELLALAKTQGVPATQIGTVGGDRVRMSVGGRLAIDEVLAEAEAIWATTLDNFFERRGSVTVSRV